MDTVVKDAVFKETVEMDTLLSWTQFSLIQLSWIHLPLSTDFGLAWTHCNQYNMTPPGSLGSVERLHHDYKAHWIIKTK